MVGPGADVLARHKRHNLVIWPEVVQNQRTRLGIHFAELNTFKSI